MELDLDKIKAEVAGLSPEELREKLLKLRTREKVQQKKSYNSEAAKRYAAKAREQRKLLKEQAIAMGIWDDINEQAEKLADSKLEEEAENSLEAED